MRAGPSGSDCRIRVQTTVSCFGPMAEVVSVTEKAGYTRQVRAGKTNASKPSMICRKRRNVAETRLLSLAWEEARRKPADCPSGDRHEDGVRPARGSCVERGNLSPRCQGRTPSGRPTWGRVPMRGEGAVGSVLVTKPGIQWSSLFRGVGRPQAKNSRAKVVFPLRIIIRATTKASEAPPPDLVTENGVCEVS